MGIDMEVEVGQAEKEGRTISSYMFEGPEDTSENAADNSVWLDLEIAYFFFQSWFWMHVHTNYSLELYQLCRTQRTLSLDLWAVRSVKMGFYPWRVRVTQWDWPSSLLSTYLCCSGWVSGPPSHPPTTSRCCPRAGIGFSRWTWWGLTDSPNRK